MKTLIFNSSPRKYGDTNTLINKVLYNLEGEYKIENAYDCNIMPCTNCIFAVFFRANNSLKNYQ